MCTDKITTVVGGIAAAATAAQPVLNSVQGASLHQQDYFQLITAVLLAVLGFFTNKKNPAAAAE